MKRTDVWQEEDNTLQREFSFVDFKSALAFVNKVAELAEEQNHHPDIEFGWGRVRIILTTHSANSVTDKDRQLAAAIDTLLANG